MTALARHARQDLGDTSAGLLEGWPAVVKAYSGEEQVVRDREPRTQLTRETLSGNRIPRVALPRYTDHGDLLRFLREENLPGYFPFTAGVFPSSGRRRTRRDVRRGGDPFRTNRRFKLLAEHAPATRLSTAFDCVTLYGRDPDEPPDVYGKVGTAGFSIATLDDMKTLYAGFDLLAVHVGVDDDQRAGPDDPGFLPHTAIDQGLEAFASAERRPPSQEEAAAIRAEILSSVRGTVQADILKEDQGQNTCIFSTEFACG